MLKKILMLSTILLSTFSFSVPMIYTFNFPVHTNIVDIVGPDIGPRYDILGYTLDLIMDVNDFNESETMSIWVKSLSIDDSESDYQYEAFDVNYDVNIDTDAPDGTATIIGEIAYGYDFASYSFSTEDAYYRGYNEYPTGESPSLELGDVLDGDLEVILHRLDDDSLVKAIFYTGGLTLTEISPYHLTSSFSVPETPAFILFISALMLLLSNKYIYRLIPTNLSRDFQPA